MARAMRAVMAPPTSRSPVVTSLPCLSQATTILFIRSRMSARLVATARMAMTSEDTVIWNPLFIMKPSILPADADDDVPEGLGAEVHGPLDVHVARD